MSTNNRVHKGDKASADQLDLQVNKALLDHRVLLDDQDHKVIAENGVKEENLDHQDRLGLLDHLENEADLDLQDLLEREESPDLLVRQDQLDLEDLLEREDHQDQTDNQERQVAIISRFYEHDHVCNLYKRVKSLYYCGGT